MCLCRRPRARTPSSAPSCKPRLTSISQPSPPASAGGPFAVFFLAVPWLAIGAQARGRDREKRCTRHRAHLCLSLVHAHVDASRGDTQSEEA